MSQSNKTRNEQRRARYASDPDYRAKRIKQARANGQPVTKARIALPVVPPPPAPRVVPIRSNSYALDLALMSDRAFDAYNASLDAWANATGNRQELAAFRREALRNHLTSAWRMAERLYASTHELEYGDEYGGFAFDEDEAAFRATLNAMSHGECFDYLRRAALYAEGLLSFDEATGT